MTKENASTHGHTETTIEKLIEICQSHRAPITNNTNDINATSNPLIPNRMPPLLPKNLRYQNPSLEQDASTSA